MQALDGLRQRLHQLQSEFAARREPVEHPRLIDGLALLRHRSVIAAALVMTAFFIPIGAYEDNGTYHLYYIGPLTSGAGNLRHRWGSTPTSLTNDELVLSGTWRASRGLSSLDSETFLITLGTSSNTTSLRTIAKATPGTISAEVDSYPAALHNCSLSLDTSTGVWRLINLFDDADAITRYQAWTAPAATPLAYGESLAAAARGSGPTTSCRCRR
jgi:hypothetical protein